MPKMGVLQHPQLHPRTATWDRHIKPARKQQTQLDSKHNIN